MNTFISYNIKIGTKSKFLFRLKSNLLSAHKWKHRFRLTTRTADHLLQYFLKHFFCYRKIQPNTTPSHREDFYI